MNRKDIVLWDVDTQADFMLPGGKLYVPGAEKIIPNLKRLVDGARRSAVLHIASVDAHAPDDKEFQQWPPHCIAGTPGQEKVAETLQESAVSIPNRPQVAIPESLYGPKQVILEKQTLNVFDNPHTERLLERLGASEKSGPEFLVCGVVTEYCVRLAAKGLLERGHRVALVTDAVETLKPEDARRTLDELQALGARLVTTDEAVRMMESATAKAVPSRP